MQIEIIDDANYLVPKEISLIEEVLEYANQYLNLPPTTEVDVSIVSNEEIQILNRDFRHKDTPTDVLSFALKEGDDDFNLVTTQLGLPYHLGDIVISYQKMVEQANEYGHSTDRELAFLVVHGFLHLNGYDHMTAEEEAEMFGLQNEILEAYGLGR